MAYMELSWNDRPGTSARRWGLPAPAAVRQSCFGAFAAQQRSRDLVRQPIGNARPLDVFDHEWLRQVMVDHADAPGSA